MIAKVDYRPGSAHTVTPRVIVRKFNQSANGSATATNVPLTASRGPQYQLNDSSQVAWTWVMSSSSLLDSRVEFRRNHLQNGCFAAPTLFGWSDLADCAHHSDVRVSVWRAHPRLQWPVG